MGSPNLAHSRITGYAPVCKYSIMLAMTNGLFLIRGQLRLYRELLLPRRPNGPFNEKEYLFHVSGDKMSTIRESLYQTLQLRVSYYLFIFCGGISRFTSKTSNSTKLHPALNIYFKQSGTQNFLGDSIFTEHASFFLPTLA
jgi:hypothetical protein